VKLFGRSQETGGFDRRDRELLMGMLVSMGALVRDNLSAVLGRLSGPLDDWGMPPDEPVDSMEVRVEQECLRLMALRQPLREDLRFCFAVLRIAKDLERMGDEAQNVYEELSNLKGPVDLAEWGELPLMGSRCLEMMDDAMDSMVRLDGQLAVEVFRRDDQVDQLWGSLRLRAAEAIGDRCGSGRDWAMGLLSLLAVGRHLERVADHCANVAELAYFVITGRRLRGEEIP